MEEMSKLAEDKTKTNKTQAPQTVSNDLKNMQNTLFTSNNRISQKKFFF